MLLEQLLTKSIHVTKSLFILYKTNPTIDILRWPCPHNSKQLPLNSPLFKSLKVIAELMRPGITSILIPHECIPNV